MKKQICGNCKHWHRVSSVYLMNVEGVYDNWGDHGACGAPAPRWALWCPRRLDRNAAASDCDLFEERIPWKRKSKLSGRIPPME